MLLVKLKFLSKGWNATFDGRNHMIKNLTLAAKLWDTGVFGNMTGTVKNVAFINAEVHGYGGGVVADQIYGTIENVLVVGKVCNTYSTAASTYTSMLGHCRDGYGTIKNVTLIATQAPTGVNMMISCSEEMAKTIENLVVIGAGSQTQISRGYATIADIVAANANIKPYLTDADAAADTTLTASGSATFVRNNGAFNVLWNGTNVYGIEVINSATAYDYSLGNKTIDLSKIPELSGKTVTGITHEDGTAIAYTVDGNVITIGDDTKDVLDAVATTATGATTNVIVLTAEGKYKLPLTVCTLAIRTPEEFLTIPSYYDATAQVQNGYYVLCNDLDFTGKANYVCTSGYIGSASWGRGFLGTFDGRNHIVKNLTIDATSYGVFGSWITGTFKNVALVDVTHNGTSGVIGYGFIGTVENVLVTGKMGGGSGAKSLTANTSYSGAKGTKNVTVIATAAPSGHWRLLNKYSDLKHIKGTVIAIGAGAASQVGPDAYTTVDAITAANTNLKPYLTAADAAAANLAANGSATFETSGTTFNVKWNGTTVYTATVG